MKDINKTYLWFGLAMLLLQLAGYNVATLGLLGLCSLPLISANTLIKNIRAIPIFFIFITFSIIVGLYFALCDGLESWKLMYWGQFYFFIFLLMAVKDKVQMFTVLRYCTYIIFFADFFTNLLLLAGFNVPWSSLPDVRPGEKMARFTGIKGNTLYSGSISFIALCFLFHEDMKSKLKKYSFIFAAVLNIALSGSFRYYIITAVVFSIYYLHLYKHRTILIAEYIGSIIVVFLATRLTMLVNGSNFFRFNIWSYYFNQIEKSPIIGHGWFNMHLTDLDSFSWTHLAANGVTESCILLLAYCFGIPLLIFYLAIIAKTLLAYKTYTNYLSELGLFAGLSLDLFWGGSFDNSLSLSILTLSWYLINLHSLECERNNC